MFRLSISSAQGFHSGRLCGKLVLLFFSLSSRVDRVGFSRRYVDRAARLEETLLLYFKVMEEKCMCTSLARKLLHPSCPFLYAHVALLVVLKVANDLETVAFLFIKTVEAPPSIGIQNNVEM